MKKCVLLLLACVATSVFAQSPKHSSAARQMDVAIHANVELLGFVYFLGYEGAQSQTDGYSGNTRRRYAYGLALYNRYKSFAGSRNLAVAIGFAENIWLDYFINLLIQLDDFPQARLHDDIHPDYYRRFSAGGDLAEARKNATVFLDAMNALHREVKFDAYLQSSSQLYASAIAQVRAGLPDSRFLPAMESFYQDRYDRYQLIPSLTLPAGMGFGARYTLDGQRNAVHVFGTFAPPSWTDSTRIDMGFGDRHHLLELSTHEFGHSFVNSLIDSLPDSSITGTQSLFEPIKQLMANQGYTTWKACLYEHFVRAGEVVIARQMGREADADRLRQHYRDNRHFIYLDVITGELGKYDRSQKGGYAQAVRNAMQRLREQVK